MELHPILDNKTILNSGLWYVFSALGESPSIRVGHTCTFIHGANEGDNGKLYVIGGANPSGPFCDTYVLDLNSLQWDVVDTPGFRARYEHAAFVPQSFPTNIYVFGGADQTGNMNDLQVLDTTTNSWRSLNVSGTPPSERTFHTSACIGDKFFVYSGGHCGPDPVGDREVYCFDATVSAWTKLAIKGDSPKPRHGHVMVAIGNRIFIHGGMSGPNFYGDLHILNVANNTWHDVKKKKVFPSARAGHSGVGVGNNMYIFGGMNRDGALDDLYKLDAITLTWTKIDLQGPPPATRLDFGMCILELKRSPGTEETSDIANASNRVLDVLEREMAKPGSASSRGSHSENGAELSDVLREEQVTESEEDSEPPEGATSSVTQTSKASQSLTYTLCVVHGGMDTEGEIFDDMLAIIVD
ncbi:hypothetical protein ACJMK2_039685 [Sinanodonta woodiana]|uniref:Rab9 effector protein with kelch motifs n=1 Tax=Sinanodonta woodiana TaxID=1069815 RepID=A0ABD3WG72_SINWO